MTSGNSVTRDQFELDWFGFSADPQFADWCLGQVVYAHIEMQELDIAACLLPCRLTLLVEDHLPCSTLPLRAELRGPMAAIAALRECPDEFTPNDLTSVHRVLALVLGHRCDVRAVEPAIEAAYVTSEWRVEAHEDIKRSGASNQGVPIADHPVHTWEHLRFRSQVEVRVAQALDRKGLLFFPNSAARLDGPTGRIKREPDFLVCQDGRWGILEVDGAQYHQAAHDHDRDRLFQKYGIRVVQHYSAQRCMQEPAQVVMEFLGLLAKNG